MAVVNSLKSSSRRAAGVLPSNRQKTCCCAHTVPRNVGVDCIPGDSPASSPPPSGGEPHDVGQAMTNHGYIDRQLYLDSLAIDKTLKAAVL